MAPTRNDSSLVLNIIIANCHKQSISAKLVKAAFTAVHFYSFTRSNKIVSGHLAYDDCLKHVGVNNALKLNNPRHCFSRYSQ